jgi:polygalacturonase
MPHMTPSVSITSILSAAALLFLASTANAKPHSLPSPFRRTLPSFSDPQLSYPRLSDYPTLTLNVYDFGAKGDEVSDDTAAFQAALDAAGKQGGGTVAVPPGKFLFKGNLVMPNRSVGPVL